MTTRLFWLTVVSFVWVVASGLGCTPDESSGSSPDTAATDVSDVGDTGAGDAADTEVTDAADTGDDPEDTGRDTTRHDTEEDSGVRDTTADAPETAADGGGDTSDASPPPPGDYYIAPDGDDDNPGTEQEPFATIEAAAAAASPGDLIYVRGGTYPPDDLVRIDEDGEEENRITMRAYPGEEPVFDFANVEGSNGDHAIQIENAEWWHIEGLEIKNGPAGGFWIAENSAHITLENCEASRFGRSAKWGATGFIVRGHAEDVLLKNCDSHHNANMKGDDKYGNADGFVVGSPDGPHVSDVVLRGCRAWHNSDDGLDLFFATNPVLIEEMWVWGNGLDDDAGSISGDPNAELGNGVGFKLGGDTDDGRDTGPTDHTIRFSVAFQNRRRGFDENANGGALTVYNNTAFDNGHRGFSFYRGEDSELRNNVSFRDTSPPLLDAADSQSNSWDDGTGVTVADDDFQSLDVSQFAGPRQPDGSLPDVRVLHLAPGSDLVDAGVDVGLDYNGSAPDLGAFER